MEYLPKNLLQYRKRTLTNKIMSTPAKITNSFVLYLSSCWRYGDKRYANSEKVGFMT